MATITVDASDGLNDYQRVYKEDIIGLTFNEIEFETNFPEVAVPGGVYNTPREELGEILQPYQSQFTPKGSYTIESEDIIAKKVKVDLQVTESELEQFHHKYKTEWASIGKNPVEWSFPRYLWEKLLAGKLNEELAELSWSGVFVAPTAGTPGNSLASVNGVEKIIADKITATTVTPVTVGALSPSTMISKLETFCENLPKKVRNKRGKILMSKTRARQYAKNYRDTYGFAAGNSDLEGNGMKLDDYNFTIVGVQEMEGSDRFILVLDQKPNLVRVRDSNFPRMPELYWIPDARSIKAAGTFTIAYGIEDPREFYVSDNA